MKYAAIILILTMVTGSCFGQNLVPNPSFENYDTIPCSLIYLPKDFKRAMKDWILPTGGTPDVFSTLVNTTCPAHCMTISSGSAFGQQMPRTGKVTTGIWIYGPGWSPKDYREYLEVKLITPLKKGTYYKATMYVSHEDYLKLYTNNLGMYFSDTLVDKQKFYTQLNFTPQVNETKVIKDDKNWVKVTGIFKATSAAKYLILGNFFDDKNTDTAYKSTTSGFNDGGYFIDDVSVIEVNPCLFSVSNDTSICIGETVSLLAHSDSAVSWADSLNPKSIIKVDSILKITPKKTTTYAAYSRCDTAYVKVTVNLPPKVNLGNDTSICQGTNLKLDAFQLNATYIWQDGSTKSNFIVNKSGKYWLRLALNNCIVSDTIKVLVNPSPNNNIPKDTLLCEGSIYTVKLQQNNRSYVWQDGSTKSTYTISKKGVYWVRTTENSCTKTDTIKVDYQKKPIVNLGKDTILCVNQMLTLNAYTPSATYLWQDGSTKPNFPVTQSGIYWVWVTINSCTLSDTISVDFNPLPLSNLPKDTTLCEGTTLTINLTKANTNYVWQDGSKNSIYRINQTGTYWVKAVENNCSSSDTIKVSFRAIPKIELGLDTTLCLNETYTLRASVEDGTYLWQDGSGDSNFTVRAKGKYWVTIMNNCGTATDTIIINYLNPPSLKLPKDTTLCYGEILTLQASDINSKTLWSDNSSLPTISVSKAGIYWASLSNKCGTSTDSIQVDFEPAPVLDLGPDTKICHGDYISLNAEISNASYYWQDHSNQATHYVTKPGLYWVKTINKCRISYDSITITYDNCACPVYIPNSFSPNNDSINDRFIPVSTCAFPEYQFIIFNRWGEKVFSTTNPLESWDGNYRKIQAPMDVYVFIVSYKFEMEIGKVIYGKINLIR